MRNTNTSILYPLNLVRRKRRLTFLRRNLLRDLSFYQFLPVCRCAPPGAEPAATPLVSTAQLSLSDYPARPHPRGTALRTPQMGPVHRRHDRQHRRRPAPGRLLRPGQSRRPEQRATARLRTTAVCRESTDADPRRTPVSSCRAGVSVPARRVVTPTPSAEVLICARLILATVLSTVSTVAWMVR